ncbi:MAG: response regulator transcription factor [Chloroflexia bacterium]|nr:response regulator transcription factor [Chloroflexia bacterium]
MNERARILVVDDDEQITSFLRRALTYAGFSVVVAHDGLTGLKQARAQPPDVAVLDVMMPGLEGMELCRRLREEGDTPILMLTARDEVADRVRGLEHGADDYLVKPFALEELVARLRALVRRRGVMALTRRSFAGLAADTLTREAWRQERAIRLTVREFDLLCAFLRQPRQVLSRGQLLDQVWGMTAEVDEHVLEVYVRYLREKTEAHGEPRLIHTVRGVGYVLRD